MLPFLLYGLPPWPPMPPWPPIPPMPIPPPVMVEDKVTLCCDPPAVTVQVPPTASSGAEMTAHW